MKQTAELINRGNLQNCPISSTDVYNAFRIYGPMLETRIGKSTRPRPVRLSVEQVPQDIFDNKEVKLFIDIFYVDAYLYLLCVSSIDVTLCTCLGKGKNVRTSEKLGEAIQRFIDEHSSRIFKVS